MRGPGRNQRARVEDPQERPPGKLTDCGIVLLFTPPERVSFAQTALTADMRPADATLQGTDRVLRFRSRLSQKIACAGVISGTFT